MKPQSTSLILALLVTAALSTTSCDMDMGEGADYRTSTGSVTIHPWPEGEIPYVIEGSFTEDEWAYLDHAMTEWSAHGAVTFIDYTDKEEVPERVLVIARTEGASSATIGYVSEPRVEISTKTRFYQRYTVQLFGHVLGLLREHQRPDRDQYIKIFWENIKPEYYRHYSKIDSSLIDEEDFPYDTMSVMHYTRTQGSKEFGDRCFDYLHQEYDNKAHYVSEGDAAKIAYIYGR